MSYRIITATLKPQSLYVGQPLKKDTGLGVGWTLANNDQTNQVFVSTNPGVKSTDSDAIPVQPLGTIPIDPTLTSYIVSAGPSVQCFLMPGGGTWAPSPAQVAAQINALGLMKDSTGTAINGNVTGVAKDATVTGVSKDTTVSNLGTTIPANIGTTGAPGLNLKTTTTLATAQAIAAGATFTAAAITGINQMAYNLHLTGTAGGASTKPWYTVTVKWVDTASGLTVQFDQFTAFMSSVANALTTVIYGPTDADQLVVSVTNNDTVGMTLNSAFVIISSRNNYTTDQMYQFFTSGNMPTIPTFQIAASAPVPSQKIIFSLSRTVGVAVTTTPDYALPGYSGQVAIGFRGVASNQWNLTMTEQFTGTILYSFDIASANTLNALWILPRAPVTIKFTNNGSVLGTMNCEIVGV